MILTKNKISEQFYEGNIYIDPFSTAQLNPNSYNYHLGPMLKVYRSESGENASFDNVDIPESGFVLQPHQMYLGATNEIIGSRRFAMSLIGRSSMGRLGLFVQCAANLGHTGVSHRWTLELVAAKPLRIYAYMPIGQVSFWENLVQPAPYDGYYGNFNVPTLSAKHE